MTFGIYVPSYRRSDTILTAKIIDCCKYVVRESEADAYRKAGVDVLPVEDSLINSIPKVENWIIENTPEDVVCMVDDDVKCFIYRLESNERLTDPDVIYDEIARMAQLIVDLDIGYMATPNDINPKFYSQEFKFCGVTGQMRIVNKSKCVARFNDIDFLNDIDFELQELLKNRIILIPCYFGVDAGIDTNKGGSNDAKTLSKFYLANETMKNKWGKYYEMAGTDTAGKLRVKR